MGLSKTDQPDITTYQLLIEIAQGLATLQSDPKALEDAAKRAYALPDAEQAKALKAREDIARYESFINQNERQKQEIVQGLADISKQKANLEAQERKIASSKIALNNDVSAFEQTKKDTLALADDIKAREKSYDDRMAALARKEDQLGARQANLETQEADMASRLEQMRLLAGGK